MKPWISIFLNQHSNVYLEKDERQALRTRKHYIQIFFGWFYWYFHEISMFANYIDISHHLKVCIFQRNLVYTYFSCCNSSLWYKWHKSYFTARRVHWEKSLVKIINNFVKITILSCKAITYCKKSKNYHSLGQILQ